MRTRHLVYVFILSCLPLPTATAETPPEKLTLSQTLERALEKSFSYRSLLLKEESAKLSEKNAWWAMAPAVDLSASHSYLQYSETATRANASGYPFSTQAGLSVTENLYDNGETWRNADIASYSRQVSTLSREQGRSRLMINVAKAFYDYSEANVSMDLKKQQLAALKVQYGSIESRYRQGLTSNRDFLRIQAQVQSSEISLMSQQLQINSALTNLRVAMGEYGNPEFLVEDPTKQARTSVITVQELRPEQSYEYRIAELENKISDLRFENTSRTQWPRLSLKGSFDYIQPEYLGTQQGSASTSSYWNLQAMLLVEYRLWDWGSRWRNVDIADNSRKIENNNQELSKLQTARTLEELRKQSELLQNSFKINQQMLKANESAYQSLNRAYREGTVTYLELITSLNDWYSSRVQDLNLRINILKLRAELSYYQGNVDEVLKSN